MGLIGRVLSLLRETKANGARVSFAKFAANNEPTLRGQHFGAPGDDAVPLAGDYVYSGRAPRTGEWAALGYLDSVSTPTATPGERRIYSRSGPGEMAAEVWLRADGTIHVRNGSGSIELQSGGDVVINGVTIDTDGNISTGGTVEGAGVTDSNGDVTLGTHTHSSSGSGPPVPGS